MIANDQAMRTLTETLGLRYLREGFGDIAKTISKKVGSLASAKQKAENLGFENWRSTSKFYIGMTLSAE